MDIFLGGTGYTTTTVPLVWHSPDRGLTWTQETLPAAATGFVGSGATTGGAAILPANASNGNVYARSAATGAWSTVATGNASASYNAAAMTFSYGVVVGSVSGTSAAIAYTANDGAAWTVVPTANITPAAANVALYGVCLGPGATNGWWAVGGAVIIHASGNAPSAWAQQGSTVTAGASLRGCVATDSMHAWAYGASGVVFTTSDGGTTWAGVTTPPATTQMFNSGAHSSGAALTLVGTNGIIFRSTNGGSSFAAEELGPQDPLTAAFGPAPNDVYAIGPNGVIYNTTDDGATWTKLAIPAATGTTASLSGIWGASATDVYAVGASGTIVHSSNGTTFTKYAGTNAPPTTTTFNDVWGSATLGVFAVGTDGAYPNLTRVVYRSTDHGATWAQVNIAGLTGGTPAGTNTLFTTFALGSDVWVAGDGGKVYHSADGTNFTQQNTGVTNLGVLRVRGINNLLIATLGNDPGSYLSSTNGGTTWTAPTTGVFGSQGNQIVITPDGSAIYMFMTSSVPQVSYDNLATWPALVTVMNPNSTRGGFAFAANDVFAVGDTGIIHYGN
ncbi:MAG TPA: YCF48-related protein, partial [Polyangia bacterium]